MQVKSIPVDKNNSYLINLTSQFSSKSKYISIDDISKSLNLDPKHHFIQTAIKNNTPVGMSLVSRYQVGLNELTDIKSLCTQISTGSYSQKNYDHNRTFDLVYIHKIESLEKGAGRFLINTLKKEHERIILTARSGFPGAQKLYNWYSNQMFNSSKNGKLNLIWRKPLTTK